MLRKISLAFLMAFCGVGQLHAADLTVEVIELRFRDANEMLPVLRPIVEPQGSISALQNKLVVRSTPDGIREVRALVKELDTRPRQLLITVSQDASIATRRASSGVSGAVGGGDATVIIPSDVDPDTPGIAVGTDDAVVEARKGIRKGRSTSSGEQQIRVLEGREALVYVGQAVPFSHKSAGPAGMMVEDIQYRDVVIGFDVLPRVQGDQVTLDISQRSDSLDAETSHNIVNVQRASTTVSGKLGEWIDIGGITQQQVFKSRGVLSSRGGTRHEARAVFVKVEESP